MSDDLATAYALRARAEARPGLIRDLMLARARMWIGSHDAARDAGFLPALAKIADDTLRQMYPIEGEKP